VARSAADRATADLPLHGVDLLGYLDHEVRSSLSVGAGPARWPAPPGQAGVRV